MRSFQGGQSISLSTPSKKKILAQKWGSFFSHLGYYPRLLNMYRSLGIPYEPTSFHYSFSHLLPSRTDPFHLDTHFIHSGSSGWSIPSVPSASSLSTFLRALGRLVAYGFCYIYLVALAVSYRWTGSPSGEVREWTKKTGRDLVGGWLGEVWEEFVREVLFSLFGAVGTCSDEEIERMEVGLILGSSFLSFLLFFFFLMYRFEQKG